MQIEPSCRGDANVSLGKQVDSTLRYYCVAGGCVLWTQITQYEWHEMLFDHLSKCAREETVSESFPIWSTYRLQTNACVIFSQQDVIKQCVHQARLFNHLLLCFPEEWCNVCVVKLLKKFERRVKVHHVQVEGEIFLRGRAGGNDTWSVAVRASRLKQTNRGLKGTVHSKMYTPSIQSNI